MSFGVPLFLLASLAAAIPVLLHMIHRQRAKEIMFSTLRFLKVSVQRTRRRKYIDDTALMLLRMAVLLLIAIGLARPAVSSLSGLLGRGPSTAVAIVLDNSGSMALTDDGKPRIETARRAALQVLDGLHDGDTVALFLTCGAPDPHLGQLSRSHDAARQVLAESRACAERADLASVIQQASTVLEKAESPTREMYVFTDNQAISWENLKPETAGSGSGRALPPIVLVNVNKAPMLNAVVRDVHLSAPAPVAGVPVVATAEVLNTSGVTQEKHVELHVDGLREAVSPTLTLAPGLAQKHDFHFTLGQPGVHQGYVQLVEDDGSALDNRRDFAINVDEQVPVAIVKPRRLEVAYAEDTFYLERALAPGGEGGAVKATTLIPDDLGTAALAGFAVVYCVNLPALQAPAAERLVEYVRSGGHVVWIAGQNIEPSAYNQANTLAKSELLPAPIGPRKKPAAGSSASWHLASLEKTYPAFGPLTEPASLYQSVLVYQFFPIEIPAESPVNTLIKLDDGQPLLVERAVGAGTVLFFGTGVHVDWTNLPLKPLFLPLFARLTFHLAGMESERTQVLAAAPIVVPLAPGRKNAVEAEVMRPSGETLRLRGDSPSARSFRYADTHESGVYQIRLLNTVPPRNLAFAVNMDPVETDPAVLTRVEIERRFGTRRLAYCESPENLATAITRLREGVSLRGGLMLAVLVALVAETFLANRRAALPPADVPMSTVAAAPSRPASRRPEPAAADTAAGEDISDILAKL